MPSSRPLIRQSSNDRTLAGQALTEIRRRILTGEYEPGRRLRIEELAEVLEMSPMPIREALQRLDNAGFVEHLPHRGARVSALSAEDLLDLYAIRIPLEMLAIRRAARNFTDHHRDTAAAWLEEYLAHDASDWRAREAQMEFHLALYRASGSRRLIQLIRPLFEHSERYRITALGKGTAQHRRRRHEQLLNACVKHDEDLAARRLCDTLAQTVHSIEPTLGEHPSFELETVALAAYMPRMASDTHPDD